MKTTFSYSDKPSSIAVQNEAIGVRAFQIIVWLNLTSDEFPDWNSRTPRFPAILDIGNNHNLAITQDHLVRWAGVHLANLPRLQWTRDRGKMVPLHAANLWLHTAGDPFKLDIDEGIAVYDSGGPRLPTLGLRALTNNNLQTFIYGNTKQVVIRTPPAWYWPF